MRRQANDYRDHHHGRDNHHHHHHLGHHHGPGTGGGGASGDGSTASQAVPSLLHHHHNHHHHQQAHHTHHRQNSSHFHHPIQHRSSSSSQLQHIRPNNTNQNRHRSRTSSLSITGLDVSPMSGPQPPPPPPPPSSASNMCQLPQLDSRVSEMNLGFGGKSLRDRLSSPLLTSSHHNHNNPSPNHHLSHTHHHQQQQPQQQQQQQQQHHHPHHSHHNHHHRRSYLGSSSGSSSGGSLNGPSNTTSTGNMNNSSNHPTSQQGLMINNNSSSGNNSSALASPSHSSTVLSRLERKKRLLACLDGGTAPTTDEGGTTVGSGDRLSSSSSLGNTNSRTSLPNPPILSHVTQNGSNELTSHNSVMGKVQQQQQHHLQSLHSSPRHHHSSSSTPSHHHNHQIQHHNQQQHHHHHNSAPSHHNSSTSSSAPRTPTLHGVPPRSPMNPTPLSHPTKSSSSSAFSLGSPLTTNHLNNNNNINIINDNINKTPISTNDLSRRTTHIPSHKTNSSSITNDSISSKKEPIQTSNTPSPLSTPYLLQRSSSISSVNCGSNNMTNTTTSGSITAASDKPKKTSSSYLLPNSIYNKAGPGQKSSTLSSYTQILNKGDDSRVIDIGSQAVNSDAQDPRLMKVQERIGTVLTTITNNEDYLVSTKISSLLDEQINLDSVTSSELSRRNKLKNPTTSLADSTTHKIDDQSSSEVSSSSDADLTKILQAANKSTTMAAAASTNIISKKSVMNLPLPKFACVIQTSDTTIIKKPTPDRELTTVSSSNKLLLNKTPLISLSTTRNHLSPSSLASFSNTQAAAAVTPIVDYSKFNIRKKNPSTSISSLDQASSMNAPSACASSDDEKTSPRVDVETSHHNPDEPEELSIAEKTVIPERPTTPPSPIMSRKLSIDSNEFLESPDIKLPIRREPQNVIKRRVSADEPQRRFESMSPQKEAREKTSTPEQVVAKSKPNTPDIKHNVVKKDATKLPDKLVDKKQSSGQRLDREQKTSKPEPICKPVKAPAKSDKTSKEQTIEEKKKLSSIVARDLGSSSSSSGSDSNKERDNSDDSSDDSSTSPMSSPKKSTVKSSKKSVVNAKRQLETRKIARKKFELNHRERLQTKSKEKLKGKNKKMKVDVEPSSKIKGVTKRGLKNRVKNKSNQKGRDKSKQKKSSLFDFDFDEPIYLSMYDKVKARSSANHIVTPPVNTGQEGPSTSSKESAPPKDLPAKELHQRDPNPSKKSVTKEPQTKEPQVKENTKQRKQKRQARLPQPISRRDSSDSNSDSDRKSSKKETKRNDERAITSPPVKPKISAVAKKPKNKVEKRFSAKDFVLRASDMKAKSPPSNSSSSSVSSSSSSSSSSTSSSSSSSVASLSSSSSSSENEEDEDAELSAIVAETAGRIGDEMNVLEAANSPQLSPPPSPVAMETNFMMTPTETMPSTNAKQALNMDEIVAKSSDSWSDLVSQPLNINLSKVPTHSVPSTPSPKKSAPSDLILSSPSICAKSLVVTPECSPGAGQISSLAPEASTLDNRCETEQAISTLLMEMDTDSTSEQLSRDLLIEVDSRTSMSNQSPSPRKSPTKLSTPPLPATPSPPILRQHQRQPTPPTPPGIVSNSVSTPPPPALSPVRPNETTIQVPVRQASPMFDVSPQPETRTLSPVKQIEKEDHIDLLQTPEQKLATPELPPLQPISIPSPSQHVTPQHSASKGSPSKTTAELSSNSKLVSDTQPGKHALRDEISPSTDDSRPEVKRAKRKRKKSLQAHLSNPASVDVNTPRLGPGKQPKMSPYDIFEFRDSDDDETSGKATTTELSNIAIKTPEISGALITCNIETSPNTSKNISPPVSSNLLQTVASMQMDSTPSSLSPKLPLNLAQSACAPQKTPPQPAISPSSSSNENKDPDPQAHSGASPAMAVGLLQTVELKTDILKSISDAAIKQEVSEECLESPEATQRQREREYVTELNQDGKLSLTIRKASNQTREMLIDPRPIGKQGSSSSEPLNSNDVDQLSTGSLPNEDLAEVNKPTTPQPSSSNNVKPTRRSARLMQTTKKELTDDEQQPTKEVPVTQQTVTIKAKTQTTLIHARDSTITVAHTENQPPPPNATAKDMTQPSSGSEALKESQPSICAEQVPEPPVKTRRYTRGKKANKQQQQTRLQEQEQIQQALPQPHVDIQPQNTTKQQQQQPQTQLQVPQPNVPQIQQQQIKFASQPEITHASTTQVPATESRRPKRLTRLAAKTYGGTGTEPAGHAQPLSNDTPQLLQQSQLQTTQQQLQQQPQSHQQPQQNVAPTQPPVKTQQPTFNMPQHHMPPQPRYSTAVPQSSSAQLVQQPIVSSSIDQVQAPNYKPNFGTSIEAPIPKTSLAHNDENSSSMRQPSRNSTPNVESFHSGAEKGPLFCIPSYLPPRKRLGWFWSQKQLLEQRYLVVWTSRFSLKDSFAAVQMHFISGNNKMPSWSYRAMLDETGMPLPIQINQRMRLEPDQLEGVQRKLANTEDHCVLLAIPVGRDQSEYLKQSNSMKVGFIDYLTSKEAAGIVYVCQPGETQPSYIIHIFPSCAFVNDHILQREPDLLNVTQNIDNLIVVITTA